MRSRPYPGRRPAANDPGALRRRLALAATPGALIVAMLVPAGASAATLQISPSGSDVYACTSAAPCQTMNRAYSVAQPGDTVRMAGGTYPSQTLSAPAKSGSSRIVFEPVLGASATVQTLRVEGSAFLTFRGFRVAGAIRTVNGNPSTLGTRDVTFENMRAQTIKIVGRVSNIAVRGGTFGDTMDWQPQIIKYNQSDPESSRPSNILIEGATFQNFLRSGSAVHTECLQVLNVDGLVVRNSRFNNCDGTGDIGITDGPSNNLLFENNFLGKAGDAYYSMQITKNVTNLVLRNNSASKAAIFSDTESGGPYTVTGNYMPFSRSLCVSGATYSQNVFAGGTCGSTDRNVSAMRFKNADGFDLHLAAGSEAIDAVSSGYPGADIDGQSRPSGVRGDAGADEVSSAAPSPTPTPTPTASPSPTPTATPSPTPSPTAKASFSYSPAYPHVGEEVTFDGTSSVCASPCTYTWTDDGPDGPGGTNWSLGTGPVHKRTFTAAGDPTKYVRLTVRGADGAERSVMAPVYIAPAETTAAFTVSPANPRVGQTVTFDASGSSCNGGCSSYTWEDDGPDGPGGTQWPLGTGKVLQRSFTAAGDPTKYVRLIVRAADGSTDEAVKNVYIAP